ncbi:MAG: amino acid ABC transporter permease [Clostridia bacterium]|nr:amino acid ABC transporter permease [Clostridia bacterium]
MKNKKKYIFAALVLLSVLLIAGVCFAAGESANSGWENSKFYLNFVKDSRWKYLTTGLATTLIISFFAVLIGIVLGFIIAIVRSTCDMAEKKTFLTKAINGIFKAYITVIRGTPSLIQLLIIYYVIFTSPNISKTFVAVISFGLNSSAYIAEIVRSGIMSIDIGQFEAGRSLGFTHAQTMWHFILPQAFKNILPPLGNEFIVLVKETAIVGYVALSDLTRVANQISARTYEAFMPLIGAAVIYFIITKILSILLGMMERRLRKSDNR